MLVRDGMEFHNVACFEEMPLRPGLLLPRYPAAVRNRMTERGRFVSMQSAGCEIRFVTEAANVRLHLSSHENPADIHVFRGDYWVSVWRLEPGRSTVLHLAPPDLSRFRPEALAVCFPPHVWRVRLQQACVVYHGAEFFGHAVRPPAADEKPRLSWLAFGSSITHADLNGYIFHAAKRLGVDVQDKGLSGACFCEPDTVDFVARGCDWDFATLELGVNMRDSVAPDDFRRRAAHAMDACLAAKPGRPVFLLNTFPNGSDFELAESVPAAAQRAFRGIIRELAAERARPELRVVEGDAVLDDTSYLAADMVHPTHEGHALMGLNLAAILRPHLEAAFGGALAARRASAR